MRKSIILGVLAIGGLLCAGTGSADITILDFSGFVFESDNAPGVQGFPPSDPGDILSAAGFIEAMGPELPWSLATHQITLYITDLVSTGAMDAGGGMQYILYTGGTVWIVADEIGGMGFTSSDYGQEPPNATVPGSFTDGEVYLVGEFSSFYMTYHASLHAGSYEGFIQWTGGTQLNELYPNPEGYTIAGTVDPLGAPIPQGFDLEAVGHISFDPAIPVETNTWGQVKTLYR